MSTLSALFNAPIELELEGKTYKLRQPTQVERGEYEAWMEKRALDAILRQTGAPQDVVDRQLNSLTRDKVRGVYAWGGEVCCETVVSQDGLAKLLSIVLRDQGVTLETARLIAEQEHKRVVYSLFPQETDDQKKVAAAVATLLGLAGPTS